MTILEALTFRGVKFRRNHAEMGEIFLNCPFCSDSRYRLGFNFRKDLAHCFNCGFKSRNAKAKIFRELSITAETAKAELDVDPTLEQKQLELPDDFTLLSTVNQRDGILWQARLYLLRRGVTPQQIEKHYLGACLTGRFAFRIIVPVVYKDELKGIVARDWTGANEPKYLNSSGERSVYNLRKRKGPLVLSEGVFKALALALACPLQSAALLGHSITATQISQIQEQGFEKIILWPDPDNAGITGALTVAEVLSDEGFHVGMPYPLPEKQADELPKEELSSMLREGIVKLKASTVQKVRLAAGSL